MKVTVNDQPQQLSDGATIGVLLEQLDVPARQVAVEVNGQLVPRERHGDYTLSDADRIEVVTLAGGG